MSFNLTESPWIRAGRKYSIRVSQINRMYAGFLRTKNSPSFRICGRTPIMAPLFVTLPVPFLDMVFWLCCSRMLEMNLQDCTQSAAFGGNAQTRTEPAWEVKCIFIHKTVTFKTNVFSLTQKLLFPVHQWIQPCNRFGFDFICDGLERTTRLSSISKVMCTAILRNFS